MKYRKVGDSDVKVSVIGHGTWPLGNDFFGDVDEKRGIEAIRKSVDCGVNLIDTAPGYGLNFEAEYAVGKAIKGIRDKVVISTKFGILRAFGDFVKCLSPAVVKGELEASLKRLGTDYIDIYMVHWPDANAGIEGALECLAQFKKEGKIRVAAVSNFTVDEMKTAKKIAGISCIQPPLSLFNRAAVDSGVIPWAAKENIGIMTYGSLAGGILSGKIDKPLVAHGNDQRATFYPFFQEPMWTKCNKMIEVLRGIAQNRNVSVGEVSINWVLAQPGVTTALMGTTNPQNAEANAKAGDWELSADELALINKKYAEIFG